MSSVGQGLSRADGRLKVTGAAPFAADHTFPRLAYGVLVQSTIAHGNIMAIDAAAARAMRGVLLVMTHENAPRLPKQAKPPPGTQGNAQLTLLQDKLVQYNGQPIAVVVADTLEHAQDAARTIRVRYATLPAVLNFSAASKQLRKSPPAPDSSTDSSRGNVTRSMALAAHKLNATYTTPLENHNPMEPHATIAAWDGDALTLVNATQNLGGVRKLAAATFKLAPEQVHVLCPFVGGGFGCKGTTWSHVLLAAMAARLAACPVKLVLDRTQMFGPVGARPITQQHFRIGAASDGTLNAVIHDTISSTSFVDDFSEPCTALTRVLYNADSLQTTQRLATMHLGVPTFMRAPGESSGSFALESALDETAGMLGMDPIALRLQNYAERDPEKQLPFSSKSLRECYRLGAERFGWARRTPAPRSMREGRLLVGWGMATASYPARRQAAKASASVHADGSATVSSATHDLGTGTYTVMAQIAADALGVPVSKVTFALGDTALPEAPVSGGSQTVASVGPAVQAAALAARDKVIALAVADPASPLHGAPAGDVIAADGWLTLRGHEARRDPMAAVIARHGGRPVDADGEAKPGDEKKQFSMHSFGAVFVEVHVDPNLGSVRVARVVGVYDVGKLINKKTGHSQLLGGIVWGVGMGLMEKTEIDERTGRALNANLADYHVPVNADIGAVDITVLDGDDTHFNPLGARGIGEIGIVGVAAALANAVYHATGKRIRDLPITPDKLV